MAGGHFAALLSVGCGEDVVVVAERFAQEGLHVAVVVDDEDDGLILVEGVGGAVHAVDLFGHLRLRKTGGRGGWAGVLLNAPAVEGLRRVGDVAYGEGDSERGALAKGAFHADGAAVELHEGLGERKADARAVGVRPVSLEEAVEDVADVAGGDALAGVGHLKREGVALGGIRHVDAPIVGGVLEGVGDEVQHHALYLFGIDGEGERGVGLRRMEGEAYVAAARAAAERVYPVGNGLGEVGLGKVEGHLAVFVFAEIEDLVDEAADDFQVLVGELGEGELPGREVGGGGKLRHGLGDESEGRTEVVGHVGEKHEFRLRGLLELLVEPRLLVAFLLELAVLEHKFLLMPAVLPVGPEEQEAHAEEQDDDGHAGVEERGLHVVLRPIVVDFSLEELDFPRFGIERFVLQEEDVGVGKVDG